MYYPIEPFTKLFTIHYDGLVNADIFEAPGTTLNIAYHEGCSDFQHLVQPYFKTDYKFCSNAAAEFIWEYLTPVSIELNGILVAGMSHSPSNYPWPKYEIFTRTLYGEFKCNLFLIPAHWRKTAEYFYGVSFLDKYRILTLIPSTFLSPMRCEIT